MKMRPDLKHETRFQKAGFVAGIDEAGRGPLAGPVVAGAVILGRGFAHPFVHDSKKLTEKRREMIFDELSMDPAVIWSVAVVEAEEIDRLNILRATHLAMKRAAQGLPTRPAHCLIDGLPVRDFPYPQTAIVKGDQKSLSIATASIFAKVTRDRLMREAAALYPDYGFETHKGYGTKRHLEVLQALGPCPLHRRTFQPVAQLTLPFG